MKIPFFNLKKPEEKYYFGLFLKEEEGIGLVLKKSGESFVVVDKEKFNYSNGWENLLEDVDEVTFRLEGRGKFHLSETIFFVYSHLVDEKTRQIKKNYLTKIKDLVTNLEFKALGYIECYEAVSQYLEKKEGMPLTGILVELDRKAASVFVYKGGRIVFEKVVERSSNLSDDLLTCFDGLKTKMLLPARIILYNSRDLDAEATSILTKHWGTDLFIQLPKVEVVKEEQVIDGLLSVFASQITDGRAKVNLSNTEYTDEKPKEEVLGFVIGGDVQNKKETQAELETAVRSDVEAPARKPDPFTAVKNFLSNFKLNRLKLPNINLQLSVLVGLVLVILALVLNEYLFHKADLIVYLPAIKMDKQLNLTSADVAVNTATNEASLSQSTKTTGQHDIGDKAKGTVAIKNFTLSNKTFPAGTILSASNQQFTLDSSVTVPAGNIGDVLTPGTGSGSITASVLGPQSNLAKGQQFQIQDPNASSFRITNEADITGGSKKTVQTVAKKDIDDLKNSILQKAKNQSSSDTLNLSSDDLVIGGLTQEELVATSQSKEIGEEATSVTLNAKVNTTFYYYKHSELVQYLINKYSSGVPSGYKLQKTGVNYTIDKALQKNGVVAFAISAHLNAIKDISKSQIVSKVVGQTASNVKNIVKNQFGADAYELTMHEPLPFFNLFMPFFQKNISLKIASL